MVRSLALMTVLSARVAFGAEASPARQSPPESPNPPFAPDAPGTTYADRVFDAFTARYFKGYFDAHPEQATELGLHEGKSDQQLPNLSRGALGREANRLRSALKELSGINPKDLSRDHALDRRFLLASIQANLLDLLQVRSWQQLPSFYNDSIAAAINTLVKRNFAPPEERLRDVISRENQIPIALREAMENLDNPPQLWAEIAIDDAQGTEDFLSTDVRTAFVGVGDAELQDQFQKSTQVAVSAYQDYVSWLKDWLLPRAHGDWRLGEDRWRAKLLYEEMVDMPIDRLLDLGFAEMERQQRKFRETAAEIDPNADPVELLHKLTREHGKSTELISNTQNMLSGLRDFIIEKGIVDLPTLQLPIVAETPQFERAFTFAAMDTPGAFEQKAHEAYFYLTLPEPSWTPEHAEEHMEAYWSGDLANTAIHEAYPGHYVQFLWLPYSPTYTRKVLGANTFIEGWAHYTEEMLLEEGYGNQDPKLWLSAEQWALVRACRYLVGTLMHTRGMSLEDGVAFFEKNAYLSHANAVREAQRGTADPIYLYYTLGKLQIRQLRRDVEAVEGPKFSLRRFHDRLLSQGMMPLSLVREAMGYAMERDELNADEGEDTEAPGAPAAVPSAMPSEDVPAALPMSPASP